MSKALWLLLPCVFAVQQFIRAGADRNNTVTVADFPLQAWRHALQW